MEIPQLFFLEEFGKAFVPKRFRPNLRAYFLKAGVMDVPYKMFGGLFYASIVATFIFYFWKINPIFLNDPNISPITIFLYTAATWFVLPLALTAFFGLALYFYIDMMIYNRTKKMEEVLPDFLRFVSENLKGGMSFEKALWSSIKPEFGILAGEVRLAAKKVMTGQEVEEALNEFTSKYDSPIMKRAFDLITEGMKGGGRIAELIDRIIEDIEEMRELKAEMRTTNLSYIIFVTFVVLIVTPALFTLSYQFLIVLQGLSSKLGDTSSIQASSLPISFGKVAIDSEGFRQFSMYALAIISGFSAIIVSIISKGNIKGGIRLVPIYIFSSITAYTLFMIVTKGFFSSLI